MIKLVTVSAEKKIINFMYQNLTYYGRRNHYQVKKDDEKK